MNTKTMSILYLIIAIICFSTFEVVSKPIMQDIHPLQLTFIRFLIGGLVLLPFALSDQKKREIKVSLNDFLLLLLLGVLNVVFSMSMVQYAIKYIPASLVAVIFSSNPLFVSLFSTFILKEVLNGKKIMGLLVGITGVVIAFSNMLSTSESIIIGICLALLSAVIFSLFTVLGKKVSIRLGSLYFTAMTSILGSLSILPLMIKEDILPFAFNPVNILPQLVYLSIIVTGIAYVCYFKALESLDTSLGSMTFFVKPLLASVLAAIFLGEIIRPNLLFGMMMVSVGIYLVKMSVEKNKLDCTRIEI